MKLAVFMLVILISSVVFAEEFGKVDIGICGTLTPAMLARLRTEYPQASDMIGRAFTTVSSVCVTIPSNSRSSSIAVHGTEYIVGDNGTVFIQVVSGIGGVNNASCELTMFNPNKTISVNTIMTYIPNSTGLYAYDFNVNDPVGVYPVEALCVTPIENRPNVRTFLSNITNDIHILSNFTGAHSQLSFGSIGGGNEVCAVHFEDAPASFGGDIRVIKNITKIGMWWDASATSAVTSKIYFLRHNFMTGVHTTVGFTELNFTFNTTSVELRTYPDFTTQINLTSNEVLAVEPCIQKSGGAFTVILHWGNGNPSNMTRELGGVNLSNEIEYRGSGEVHVRPPLETAIDETQLISAPQNFADVGAIAFASETPTYTYCADTANLTVITSKERCIGASCTQISTNSTIVCQFGCDAGTYPNKCKESQSQTFLILMLGTFVFILFAAWAITKYFRR